MKFSIIYDSRSGNTRQAAEWIAEGMKVVDGAEARAFSIRDVDEEFVKESRGVVFGSPSYCALMTPELHSWLMTTGFQVDLGGKLGGAFATEQYTHGGGEMVIQSILAYELVLGMVVYSSGGGCGDPFIHLGPIGVNNNMEAHNGMEYYKGYFNIFGTRFSQKGLELFDK